MNQNNVRHRKRVMRNQYNLLNENEYINDDSLSTYTNQQQQQQQHRNTYVRKKPERLICSICEGPAHGYNFDAITCESCKAFFRRNALGYDPKLKCRVNDGHCIITVMTRKRCKSCRLAKCFEKGMRADWILTDEERINKKRKIEENRRLRQTIYPDSANSEEFSDVEEKTKPTIKAERWIVYSPSSLLPDDLSKIEQIKQAYSDSVRLTSLPPEIPSYPHTTRLNAPSEMMNLPTNLQTTRVITFFKLTPEFSALREHDKLVLIKYNTFALLFIRSALIYNSITDSYHDQGTDDCVFMGKDLIQCFSLHQYEQSTRCVCRVIQASQNDRLLIQMFLLIMLLSKGSAVCTYSKEPEPIAEDILSLFRTQNIFVNLFWKYCEHKFGFIKTINIWLRLITSSIDAHLQSYNTRYRYVQNASVIEQLVPLMKSVMLNV